MTSIPKRSLSSGLALSELGFGGAALGNLFRPIANAAAEEAVRAAWGAGMRFFDTAPYYGFGLSERRIGDVLREEGRDSFVLSTKVGRLNKPIAHHGVAERFGYCSPMPFEPVFDYSYDAIMRSFEHSLQRLGLSRIDILLVHDIGAATHGDAANEAHFSALTHGGFRALEELRAGGAIGAYGLGVNEWEICERAMDHARLDVFLLAGRYTLLEQSSLETFMPKCAKHGARLIIGGAYNSGILATGTKHGGPLYYNYAPAPPDVVARVARLEDLCAAHPVSLPAAALQFPLAHPLVASVIPGAANAAQIAQAIASYEAPIPAAFWSDLRSAGLVRPDAPLPQEA